MKKIHYSATIVLVLCLLFTLFPSTLPAAPAASGKFTLVHITDLHLGSGVGNKNAPAVLTDVLSAYPEAAFLVSGGDMTELGLPEEYKSYKDLLENFKAPIYHTPGNHESRWTDAGKSYFQKYLGPTYTSWNYGGVHFVTLDSSIAKGQNGHFDKQMLLWLKKDLAALPKDTPVILFTHHPFFFDEGDIEANFSDNDWDLWTTIRDYNIRAFFVGHGHRQGYWKVNGIPIIMTKAAMENGYTAITIDSEKQEMTVSLKVLGAEGYPTTTQELDKISLQKTFTTPTIKIISPGVDKTQQDSVTLKAQLQNWTTTPAKVEYKLEDNKWKPLELNGTTWEKLVDLSDVDDGIRYFWVRAVDPAGNNYVDKLQFRVAQNTNIKILWEAQTDGGIQGTPVLGAKYLYVGDNSGKVTAFSQESGKKIWEYKTGGAIIGSPTLSGNTLYFGSADGKIYALAASTGKKIWDYKTAGAVLAQPLIAEGLALTGSSDFSFYALEQNTGQLKWKFATGNTIMSKAAYGDKTVFFGSWDRNFYGVDLATGQEKWHQELGSQIYYAPAASNPLYHQGKVYLNTPGSRICALSATTGSILWESKASSGLANPLLFNDAIFNSTLSGSLYALDPESGENVWQADTGIGNYGSSPITQGGYLLLNSLTGKLTSHNVDNKSLNWSFKTGDNYTLGNSITNGNKIYVPTLAGKLYALQAASGVKPQHFALLTAFSDTGSHWARRDLNKLAEQGLMTGFTDGSFKPDSQLTKAQIAGILSRFVNYETPSANFKTTFADINKHWAVGAIAAMEEKGIVKATKDSKGRSYYRPDEPIRRGEALVMLARALGLTKPSLGFVSKFSDLSKFPAPEAIMALEEKGLVGGFEEKGQLLFKPEQILTRAQFGVFLVRSLQVNN